MGTPANLPQLPQDVPIAGPSGMLTEHWNLYFVALLRYIQANTNSIASLAMTGGAGGGSGVASGGSATAVDLTYEPSAEGTLNLDARADHTHEMAIGIEDDITDKGVANDLDFEQPLDVNVTQLVSAWKMEEASGTRANEVIHPSVPFVVGGSFHSSYIVPTSGPIADQYEIHGAAVNGEAGLIGNAARPVIDPGDQDYRFYGDWLRSPAYVGWYPLGQGAYPFDTVTEGTNGNAVSGTVCILFKPETGITAAGLPGIGGLASFNSFPYGVLGLTGGWDGGVFSVRGATTRPGSVGHATAWTACALDAWHVGFAWLNKDDATINCQLDYNPPVSFTMPDNLVWYGNFTYWMSGPRFTGLIDTSLLWRGVLTSWQRRTITDLLLASTDPDFAYEAKRKRATVTLNPFWMEAMGGI